MNENMSDDHRLQQRKGTGSVSLSDVLVILPSVWGYPALLCMSNRAVADITTGSARTEHSIAVAHLFVIVLCPIWRPVVLAMCPGWLMLLERPEWKLYSSEERRQYIHLDVPQIHCGLELNALVSTMRPIHDAQSRGEVIVIEQSRTGCLVFRAWGSFWFR